MSQDDQQPRRLPRRPNRRVIPDQADATQAFDPRQGPPRGGGATPVGRPPADATQALPARGGGKRRWVDDPAHQAHQARPASADPRGAAPSAGQRGYDDPPQYDDWGDQPRRGHGAGAAAAGAGAGAAAGAAASGQRREPFVDPDSTAVYGRDEQLAAAGHGEEPVHGGFDSGYGPDRTEEIPRGPRRQPPFMGGGRHDEQPPAGPPPGPGGPYGPGGPEGPRPPRPRKKRRLWTKVLAGFLVLLLLWVGALLWAGKQVWDKVEKVDAIPTGDRPADGKGTNIVLVGSDSREGLTQEEKRRLGTGSSAGRRTDSIMVLHLPDDGNPTLVSLPRDSYVEIPGKRKNKINASFSFGGPQLLVQTIEANTDLRIDGYMEIGFGGFASVVDSVGGVEMCLPKAMKDEKAHIDLPAGCQNLDGKNALGYVRARYSDPLGDLGRAKRQREFLGALMKKMASPGNVVNPFKLKQMGTSGAQGVRVDKDMSPWTAFTVMRALKSVSGGQGQSVQVPVSDTAFPTRSGEAVLWDKDEASTLWKQLNADETPSVKP